MIEAYSKNVAVAANAAIPLQNVSLLKGITTNLQGTSSVLLSKCGVYKVDVSAVAEAETTGNITIQLAKNDVLEPYAISTETSAGTAGTLYSLGFSTLVQVSESNNPFNVCTLPTSISIYNSGIAATYSDIKIVITRV